MEKYDIYGIGAALVDTEIKVSDDDLQQLNIDKGVMTLVDEKRQGELIETLSQHLTASSRASGGSAANTVIAASHFGASAFYSCKVANDENGAFYLSDLSEAQVSYHANNGQNKGITGKCLVMITPDAERTMNTFLGISETLSESDIDEDALKKAQFAYIEGYLVTSNTGRPAAKRLLDLARCNGVKTAISLSDPAIVEYFHEGLQDIIGSGVDLLFCNEDEALSYTKCASLEAAIKELKTIASAFAITRGSKGAVVFDGTNLLEIAPHEVLAIDTNGAGDMFAGAFIYALSQNKSFADAGRLASKAASVVVSQFGPRLKVEQHAEIHKAVFG